jgi:undecaprenyl-diphosphatase
VFEIIQAIVLGAVQGLTEFIPVSSSGHLVIVPWLLGWSHQSLLFDTVLHWGTLLSIVAVFWRDLWAIFVATLNSLVRRTLADANARLGWFIVVGSIPAAITGILFEDFFEALFSSPITVGFCLLFTAAILAGSEQLAHRSLHTQSVGSELGPEVGPEVGDELTTMNWGQAIIIGLAQAVALAPGISRSGSTMAAGLAGGLRRAEAARYSFLLGTPAFFGAALLQLLDALEVNPSEVTSQLPELVVGAVVSAIVGYLAIRGLLAYLRRRSLNLFAGYCLVVGLLVIVLWFSGW